MPIYKGSEKIKNLSIAGQYIDKVYKGSTLVYDSYPYDDNLLLFEKTAAGTYTVNLQATGIYEVACIGGGGAAAMRGVYDDKGYGWAGGSGGGFVGNILIPKGAYTVTVGKANNNTTAQSGNTQTLNPTDTKTYGSSISGVVSVGGGGSGHYNSDYVGAAGAKPSFTIQPISASVNRAGNAGASGSGGKGGGAGATINGGASVYNGYGKGQGCVVSEYATKRSWVNGSAGYVRIKHLRKPTTCTFKINPVPSNATVKINSITRTQVTGVEGTAISWSVAASGYTTQSGNTALTNRTMTVDLKKVYPSSPKYTDVFYQEGKNLSASYTIPNEGWYRIHYDNYYSASDRHAYVDIDGVEKYHWSNKGDIYTDAIYLEKGQVVRFRTNNVAFTIKLTLQSIT